MMRRGANLVFKPAHHIVSQSSIQAVQRSIRLIRVNILRNILVKLSIFFLKKKFKSHEIERIYGSDPLLSLSMNNYAEDKTLGKIDLYNIKNFLHKLQKKFNKVFELLVLQLNFNKVGRKKIENIFHTIEASGSLLFIQRRNCFEQ